MGCARGVGRTRVFAVTWAQACARTERVAGAIDQPSAVPPLGPRAQSRKVRTGGRLGKQLAPDFFGGRKLRQEAALLLFRCPRDERRRAHTLPHHDDLPQQTVDALLFLPDHLLYRRSGASTVFVRPMNARPAAGLLFFSARLLTPQSFPATQGWRHRRTPTSKLHTAHAAHAARSMHVPRREISPVRVNR